MVYQYRLDSSISEKGIYIYNSVEFVCLFVCYCYTPLFLDEMQSNSHVLWSITWEVT